MVGYLTLSPDDTDMTVDNSVLLGLIGSDYAAYVAPTQDRTRCRTSGKSKRST